MNRSIIDAAIPHPNRNPEATVRRSRVVPDPRRASGAAPRPALVSAADIQTSQHRGPCGHCSLTSGPLNNSIASSLPCAWPRSTRRPAQGILGVHFFGGRHEVPAEGFEGILFQLDLLTGAYPQAAEKEHRRAPPLDGMLEKER
ncbi:hypothetical protein ACFFX0_31545 [Citricoccus parietis]|uniref:Uncharacterized protein n=1 Tax=Citricoccus parietis TaxID=592307 RepID=A0ABV5G931_9MICC